MGYRSLALKGIQKMSKISALSVIFGLALAVAPALPAFAQSESSTPRQIQSMIEAGQSGQAVQALKGVLSQHPDSGVAWYLMAEAQDAKGHEAAAAQALAKADQYAPGLPFANPQAAEALRAHINNGVATASGGHHSSGGVSIVLLIIVALVVLFVLLRMVAGWGRRAPMNPPYPGNPNMPYGGYGPNGPYPYGQAGGMGGGLGSSIVTGLAAGAGFAAGERIVDGLMGGNDARAGGQQDFPTGSQDDGLMGNPGWDSGDDQMGGDSW